MARKPQRSCLLGAITTTLLALGLCLAAAPAGAAATAVVYPTGMFPTDLQNVQTAVDNGGIVLLKASNRSGVPTAFNFGPATVEGAGVSLTTDVDVRGEQVGAHHTTISGGFAPFQGFAATRTRIHGLTFESPLAPAIVLLASTGAEISDNTVDRALAATVRSGDFVFTDADGIDVFGDDTDGPTVTGRLTISDNVIKNLDADFSNGIQLDTVAASVAITGNTIRYAHSNGTLQTIGVTAVRLDNTALIAHNMVTLGPGRPDAFPAGIFVGANSDARYTIIDNSITAKHPNADGVDVIGGFFQPATMSATVVANTISLASTGVGTDGIGFIGAVDQSVASGNHISGRVFHGLQIVDYPEPTVADRDIFAGNNLADLASIDADVYLGPNSQHTIVAGQCRSAIDVGTDNTVDCARPVHTAARGGFAIARRGTPDLIRDAVHAALRSLKEHAS